jgi:hypothetical protein
MKNNIVLRGNATPVYAFLSLINARLAQGETLQGKKVLDCAAGGPVPPLVLFHQHGFEAWGIDVADSQLQKARAFLLPGARHRPKPAQGKYVPDPIRGRGI